MNARVSFELMFIKSNVQKESLNVIKYVFLIIIIISQLYFFVAVDMLYILELIEQMFLVKVWKKKMAKF